MLLKRLGAFFLDILEVIVFAIAFFLFLYLLVFQPHKIKGTSMDPNFKDAEYLLTDKVSYRFGLPKRGDVIVFKAPGLDGEEFIKRIIGLPGEKISLEQSQISINGKVLQEKYISSDKFTGPGAFLEEGKEIIIPDGSYFVMGDNRPHSSDSRSWGLVPKNNISGKAWFIYWPVNQIGTVEAINYNI